MTDGQAVLLLRLAGPLQSWGSASQFNRRETRPEPTKSGVLGLLAAAQGRHRQDSITDLLQLRFGVRVDQPGTQLRDYHTVSDYRGTPLPSAMVSAKGLQKPTSPAKHTHITQRFYLQDAVFVAAIEGPPALIDTLAHAVTAPVYPLALGRRSCVPAGKMLIGIEQATVDRALAALPWQVSDHAREVYARQNDARPASIRLPITVDDRDGSDSLNDVPVTFDPLARQFVTRRVRQDWVTVPTGLPDADENTDNHDPFALLGW